MTPSLLEVRDLRIRFVTGSGEVTAVDRLSFDVAAGETLAIVGESGCGKSVTAMAMMRLLATTTARVDGSVRFEDEDLLRASERRLRALRGDRLAMIFQDPMSALNPVLTVGDQIVEAIRAHRAMSHSTALGRAAELLDLVRIPEPARRLADYPHQLSGGMRQRAMIAMALAGEPRLLIADEPTTALDVTIQAQILALLARIQRELGTALILITHDLGVVASVADRVLVMYAGQKVEEQSVGAIFERPLHPYTRGLMAAKPQLGEGRGARHLRLADIPGMVPPLSALPRGCVFAPRCAIADKHCTASRPSARSYDAEAIVACHHVERPLLRGVA